MTRFFLLVLLVMLWVRGASVPTEALRFAPLSIQNKSEMVKEFIPFFAYIQKKLGVKKTQFIYEKDYAKLIEKFKNNRIDMTLLGPLPYLKLQQEYPHIQPIVVFKNAHGKAYYRCVLVHFAKDTVAFDRSLKVALTQPLSTCGYYATRLLLKEHYAIDLNDTSFSYNFSHHEALFRVLEGHFDAAGVKDSVAHDFETLGIEILAKSKPFPEFALVVNTQTLSKQTIAKLQRLIFDIPVALYQKWGGIFRYGFAPINKDAYDDIVVDFKNIPQEGKP